MEQISDWRHLKIYWRRDFTIHERNNFSNVIEKETNSPKYLELENDMVLNSSEPKDRKFEIPRQMGILRNRCTFRDGKDQTINYSAMTTNNTAELNGSEYTQKLIEIGFSIKEIDYSALLDNSSSLISDFCFLWDVVTYLF